jgi:hypothetical protein
MRHLVDYLSSDPALRVVRALESLGGPRGVREMADLCALSPRGASLVLERLARFGLAIRQGNGRALKYVSNLSEDDAKTLESLFGDQAITDLTAASSHHSERAGEVLSWIDPTVRNLSRLRRKSRGTSQSS